MKNLRYSFRTLAKNRGFTAVAVITLALGIGANTAIFSVVYAALLRPLPYREPDRLITLSEARDRAADSQRSSYPDYQDWIHTAHSFESIAGYSGDAFTMQAGDEPKNTFAAQVTPNFFSTLGIRPAVGRDFVEADFQQKVPRVAILSHALWQAQFGGAAGVIGRVIRLDGNPVTIVGVLPAEFEFAPIRSAPLWVPLHPGPDAFSRRSLRWLQPVARLKPGVTEQQARAEMEGITRQLAQAYPKENGSLFIVLRSLRERIVGSVLAGAAAP